jgi:hypothetical protein
VIARSNSANTPSIWRKRPSGGRGRVHRLLFEIEVAADGIKFAEKADQMLNE